MTPERSVAAPRWASGVTARFFAVLVVLVPSLLAVAAVGAHGLQQTGSAVNTLYRNTVLTSQAADALTSHIEDAHEAALGTLASDDPVEQRRLQTQLVEVIIPQVTLDLATVASHLEPHEQQERADLEKVRSGWANVVDVVASGGLAQTNPHARSLLAESITSTVDPLTRLTRAITDEEARQAGAANALARRRIRRALEIMALTLVAALAAGIGVVLWLIRSVLPRTLAYARFAERVADGDDIPMDPPDGHDEITQLGQVLQTMAQRGRARRTYEERQHEFTEALQLTQSEEEAHRLLKRHLERTLNETQATVLNRNNSADRLEAMTPVPAESPLVLGLEGAKPRSCLAVRQAKAHQQTHGEQPLVSCDVCSGCDGRTTCTPLLVGGEVIGAVLANHAGELGDEDRARISDSVVQAAPVLANLRNLAIAELRAATDALTGLPNKRAIADTLKRMVAQANRTSTPLAMLMLDLDHFKMINDQFGHGRGDEVLAGVGAALRSTIRDSDFAGRYGGEEFIVLLPSVDLDGATATAEKIRAAVAGITVASLDRSVTVSIGIALMPGHGNDPEALERASDRALYSAKRNGRNRIEVADTLPASGVLRSVAPA